MDLNQDRHCEKQKAKGRETKTLLIIGYHWPEPNSTAAGVRMMQLLEVFLKEGYKITFASAAAFSDHSCDLETLQINAKKIELNNSSFDSFLADLQPHVVLFDRFLTEEQFGWRVAEQCPEALRILDTEDLHSLRHVREQLFKENTSFTTDAWLRDDKTKREIASIYRCDLSLIISTYEMGLLTEVLQLDKSLILYLPFLLDEVKGLKQLPSYEERSHFMFIGGGKHSPNINAIKWLKTEIWPKIKSELPETQLYVYGAYFPQQVLELHNEKEGFLIKGRVEDANEVMQSAKVCLAPLRFGAGIKGKLTSAMQNGTPSVTTDIGAEGMHGDLPWSGSLVNDSVGIVKAAVALYMNKEEWHAAQQNGVTILNEFYTKEKRIPTFLSRIKALQANLSQHRQQNFIGSLLRHQTMMSTKYMGKWIEEKNKNRD